VDRETFLHILKIARLKLSEEEIEEFLPQFQEILDLVERVKQVSFPDSYEEFEPNPLRKDEVQPFGKDLTSIFPRKKDRYLEVPKNL
jgi:aspartyl/glutamyl-tRNA(Asn/Gln) amidotransferase C subunit